MFILAIETTGPKCSVALLETSVSGMDTIANTGVDSAKNSEMNSEVRLIQKFSEEKMNHLKSVTEMISQTLEEAEINLADVDYIAVSVGPGSFTGIRIGVSTARALAQAAGKKLIPIPTLEAFGKLEASGFNGKVVCPIINARRNQIYGAAYGKDNSQSGVDGEKSGVDSEKSDSENGKVLPVYSEAGSVGENGKFGSDNRQYETVMEKSDIDNKQSETDKGKTGIDDGRFRTDKKQSDIDESRQTEVCKKHDSNIINKKQCHINRESHIEKQCHINRESHIEKQCYINGRMKELPIESTLKLTSALSLESAPELKIIAPAAPYDLDEFLGLLIAEDEILFVGDGVDAYGEKIDRWAVENNKDITFGLHSQTAEGVAKLGLQRVNDAILANAAKSINEKTIETETNFTGTKFTNEATTEGTTENKIKSKEQEKSLCSNSIISDVNLLQPEYMREAEAQRKLDAKKKHK